MKAPFSRWEAGNGREALALFWRPVSQCAVIGFQVITHQRAVDDGDLPHRLPDQPEERARLVPRQATLSRLVQQVPDGFDKLAERSGVGDHRVLASGQHTCQGHGG
jgi:hypothetical protein